MPFLRLAEAAEAEAAGDIAAEDSPWDSRGAIVEGAAAAALAAAVSAASVEVEEVLAAVVRPADGNLD